MPFAPPAMDCQVMFASSFCVGARCPFVSLRFSQPQPKACGTCQTAFVPNVPDNPWRIEEIRRDRVIVAASNGSGAQAPFWRGDGLGRAIFGSAAVGRELRLFAPLVLFLYLDAIVDGLQKGLGQQLYLVRYNSLTNVIDVAGLWSTVPRFGLWGYLGTYCVSHLVNLFLSLRRLLIVTEKPHGRQIDRSSRPR